MSLSTWILIINTFLLAVVSPGPDFLVVLRTSLQKGRKNGISVASGIGIGTFLWSIGTLIGISSLLNASHAFAIALNIFGAVFILFYGFYIFYGVYKARNAFSKEQDQIKSVQIKNIEENNSLHHIPNQNDGYLSDFQLGLITTTLGNPKAFLFYSMIFSTMVPGGLEIMQILLLSVVLVTISFFWFSIVTIIASIEIFIDVYRRYGWIIDLFLGILFIVLGSSLVINQLVISQ